MGCSYPFDDDLILYFTKMMEPDKNTPELSSGMVEFGKRYAAAWCSQTPDQVASFFAEDGRLSVNDGAPAVGRSAIADVARGFMTAFPDMIVTMDKLVPGPERVAFHWTLTGMNTGPEGTGKSVCIRGFEAWLIDPDGLIADSSGHFDSEDYQRQLIEGC